MWTWWWSVRKDDAYGRLEFERRRRIDGGGFDVWVVSPEDLTLSKLAWARDSGSELQMRDVRESRRIRLESRLELPVGVGRPPGGVASDRGGSIAMSDMPPSVAARYRALLDERSSADRLRMCTGMFAAARRLALAGVRQVHGELTELAARRHLFLRFYGSEYDESERRVILAEIGGEDPAS